MAHKVLIVDDVAMFLELERDYLQLSAVKLFTARNGQEALQICQDQRPDLVFMDLNMPVMNGADCCQAIKRDPRLEGTAVVLITSEGKEEDRRRCLQAGCDDFLTKPLDRKLFLEAAHRLLPAIDRREKRIGCRLNVKYRALGVTRSGYVANLSQRGLYMACDFEMKKDAELDLIFALPEPDGSIIQAKGRVAWLNTREMRLQPSLPLGFGVQFVALPEDVGNNLSRYIDAQPSIT